MARSPLRPASASALPLNSSRIRSYALSATALGLLVAVGFWFLQPEPAIEFGGIQTNARGAKVAVFRAVNPSGATYSYVSLGGQSVAHFVKHPNAGRAGWMRGFGCLICSGGRSEVRELAPRSSFEFEAERPDDLRAFMVGVYFARGTAAEFERNETGRLGDLKAYLRELVHWQPTASPAIDWTALTGEVVPEAGTADE